MKGVKDRLTVRIVLLAVFLPLVGILAVSVGVQHRMRAAYLEVSRSQADALAEVVARNIERTMLDGRADITRAAVADLRALAGIAGIGVFDAQGREAFVPEAPARESDALERVRSGGFSRSEGESVVYFRPLANGPECRRCHARDGSLLGAVKVAVSLAEPMRQGAAPIAAAFAWSLAGTLVMGALLWWVLHRLVVRPAAQLRAAAAAVAAGDLGADPGVAGRDEMGALGDALRRAVQAMAEVVRRIHDVARRVEGISGRTEQTSADVVRATAVEAHSFGDIATSMQELNASIGQIAREVDALAAASAEVNEAGRESAHSAAEILARAGELTQVVEGTADSVAMLSHTVRELSWGANNITGVSGATLAAVHRLEETVRAVESAAATSAEHTARVRRQAEELGLGSVRRSLDGMEAIREAVGRTSAHLDTLGGLSQRIGEILDVIDEVTDQTSLLALNAAILAAQAGEEEGAGFQVVATEIRKLAVRTAGSTEAIADVVRGVRREIGGALASMRDGMARVEQGVVFAREAGAALETIVDTAAAATAAAAAIPERTVGQAEDLGKVRDTMGRLDQMVSFVAQGSDEQRREADRIHRSTHTAVEVARRILEANAAQTEVGRRLAAAAEQLAEGVQRIAGSLAEEREGSAQVMQALVRVVDLPRANRADALRINQGLREILGGTELLRAEAEHFRVPPEAPAGVLRLGVLPLESPAAMHGRFRPLAAYLAERLGQPVELRVALDFAEAVSDLEDGKTQVAWLSPSTFVQARTRCGARLLVTALRAGRPVQHAVIVTRRGSGIAALADLRGRTFAFGDPRSTSSHIVPRAMLLDAGLALDDLAGHDYLGHHDAVARAVLQGEYDAGAVMETVAARLAPEGLVAVAQSPPVPEFCLCARGDLPEPQRQRLQAELVALGAAGARGAQILAAIADGYTGFAAAREEDYDGVRAMMERLKLALF